MSESLREIVKDLRDAQAQVWIEMLAKIVTEGTNSWPVLRALNHVADRIEAAMSEEEKKPDIMLESTAKGLDDWRSRTTRKASEKLEGTIERLYERIYDLEGVLKDLRAQEEKTEENK
jgi:replicative DNA helicase